MRSYIIIIGTSQEKTVNSVFSYIQGAFSSWARINRDVFMVKSNIFTHSMVRDVIKPLLSEDDTLLVVDITCCGWASYKLKKEVTMWLKE